MKTYKTIAAVIFGILFSQAVFAGEYSMKAEAYIDDVPFNTEVIVKKHLSEEAMTDTFELPGEAYIDDVPFNTEAIYKEYNSNCAMQQVFEIADEEYINDFPLNTFKIAFKAMLIETIVSSMSFNE
jgi:hypothetical protein